MLTCDHYFMEIQFTKLAVDKGNEAPPICPLPCMHFMDIISILPNANII